VSVEIDQKKVTELGEGQSFGELALLFRASRAASIKCLSDNNQFFVMKPALYRSLLQQLKTAEYSRNKSTIEAISLFQCLTNKQKFSLANSIKIANFKEGDIIFNAG
jgi:cGMP-dependent protein kinase